MRARDTQWAESHRVCAHHHEDASEGQVSTRTEDHLKWQEMELEDKQGYRMEGGLEGWLGGRRDGPTDDKYVGTDQRQTSK